MLSKEYELKLIKYSSTEQFRNIIKEVKFKYKGEQLPTLVFTGTTKIHGTNASVVVKANGEQYCQSRNNILTLDQDNMGFAIWHSSKTSTFKEFAKLFTEGADDDVVFYGEWAGKGIQNGVAVSELNRFFYIFAVALVNGDSCLWFNSYPTLSNGVDIFDANQFSKYKIVIDFNNPELSQNKLVELTEAVEKECPVGKALGVSGVGEGIVWKHIDKACSCIKFKVKGQEHTSSKVKKLAEVDVEKLNSITEFIEYAVTTNRLEQAFTEVCNNNPDRKLLGQFIKWVSTDVLKEELDTLELNGLTRKDIGGPLSSKAKAWFFDKES